MEYSFEGLNFNVERNNEAHYQTILRLYKETSGYVKDFNFISKKYNTIIFGVSNIGYLAFEKENIAAYYGVFPLIMTCQNKDYLAAQSGDTLTHPNYQKKGLFTHLAKEAYALAQSNNIGFIFGFPNNNSLPGFQKKLNWVFYDKMKEIVIRVATLPLAEFVSKYPALNQWYQKYTFKKLHKLSIDPTNISLDGFNHHSECLRIKKDVRFFKYKEYSSAQLININGFLIYLKIDKHLIIGDVAYFEEKRKYEFVKTIKQIAFNLMVYKIKFYLSPNHWLFSYLKESYQVFDNNFIGFCFFNSEDPLKNEEMLFTAADFDTF